jgi:hypothetical protein
VFALLDYFLFYLWSVLVIGFYCSLVALKYNPFQTIARRFMRQDTYSRLAAGAWHVTAVIAALAMLFVTVAYNRDTSSQTLYEVHVGYCSMKSRVNVGLPTTPVTTLVLLFVVLMSITSYAVIWRYSMKSITAVRFWPVYVRIFTISVYFVASYVVQTVTTYEGLESTQQSWTVASITFSLTPAVMSVAFLVSERLFFQAIRAACCQRDGRHAALNRNPQLQTTDFDEDLIRENDGAALAISSLTKSLNGFTSCVQSLLTAEVEGISFHTVTDSTAVKADDDLLQYGKRGSRTPGTASRTSGHVATVVTRPPPH